MTLQPPTNEHPPWCVMHIDGQHVGELELANMVNGFNIYTRPVDYGDDQVGIQVIVARPDGTQVKTVNIDPDAITEAAWLSDLRQSLAVLEGEPGDGEEGR